MAVERNEWSAEAFKLIDQIFTFVLVSFVNVNVSVLH